MVSLTCLLQESVLLNEGPNPDTQPSSLELKKAGVDLSKKQAKDAEVKLHAHPEVGACQLVPAWTESTAPSSIRTPLNAAGPEDCRGDCGI